jgi:ATP-dependent RNA helicase DDX49/DBP8
LRRVAPEPIQGGKKHKKFKQKTEPEPEIDQPPATMIFCTHPRTAAYLTILLKTLHIRSTALHSGLTQRERLTSLSLFRSSVVSVLVSTDVGSRGLDMEDVAMVINWDMPNDPAEYIHRVGRTARAGKGGMAVSFVTEKDEERVLNVEERISKLCIWWIKE